MEMVTVIVKNDDHGAFGRLQFRQVSVSSLLESSALLIQDDRHDHEQIVMVSRSQLKNPTPHLALEDPHQKPKKKGTADGDGDGDGHG